MQSSDRDGGGSVFPLPDIHLRMALWCLCCTVALAWGAWSSVGGQWFAGEPLVLRSVMGALLGAIAIGMFSEALAQWKRYRARGIAPEESIDRPRR